MKTHCNQKTFPFQTQNSRKIVAHFNGGNITSDAGGLLLQQAERITGIISQFERCFTDHRDPDLTEHSLEALVAQRVYAIALGYEDLGADLFAGLHENLQQSEFICSRDRLAFAGFIVNRKRWLIVS